MNGGWYNRGQLIPLQPGSIETPKSKIRLESQGYTNVAFSLNNVRKIQKRDAGTSGLDR